MGLIRHLQSQSRCDLGSGGRFSGWSGLTGIWQKNTAGISKEKGGSAELPAAGRTKGFCSLRTQRNSPKKKTIP